MKKVLVAGAALMLMTGSAATVHAVHFPSSEQPAPKAGKVEVKPGVVLNGDARVRLWYADDNYGDFGNQTNDDSEVNMDSRVRLNLTGTAAGGAYAKARIRMYESFMGDIDLDPVAPEGNNNIWVDLAYVGIPFTDQFTLELGKYRSTYGPMTVTHNFFYDDVHLTGARGIMKVGGVTVNPFIEWMEEAQNDGSTVFINGSNDRLEDNDAMRYGVHAKGKIKDWNVGGILGYQTDDRKETLIFEQNDGFFASLYTSGRAGAFGLIAEVAMTEGELNNFNSWEDDSPATSRIGSDDTGFGGYVFPNFQMDKLNIGLNLGFTDGGFQPDTAFGFVMIGSQDNSRISAVRIGDTGDWLWAGLVAEYTISESLKLTGNLVYADVDAWDSIGENGEGPNTNRVALNDALALDSAWELSAVLQYTISKGADVFFSAGYLMPEFDNSALEDDGAFGALTRFELKF